MGFFFKKIVKKCTADHSQEEWAKFGYRSVERTVEIFWSLVLATCWNSLSKKLATSNCFFSLKIWQLLCMFPKENLRAVSTGFFLVTKVQKFAPKKTHAGYVFKSWGWVLYVYIVVDMDGCKFVLTWCYTRFLKGNLKETAARHPWGLPSEHFFVCAPSLLGEGFFL